VRHEGGALRDGEDEDEVEEELERGDPLLIAAQNRHAAIFSGGLRLRERWLPERHPEEPLPPPRDGELLPFRGQVEVVAEAVAELVGADRHRRF
jgi:hypothetical protein